MKDDHELDELLQELYKPDPAAVDRVIAAALKPAALPGHRRAGIARLAIVAAGILVCAFLLVMFIGRSPKPPDRISTGRPGISAPNDQELLRWVDGLVNRDMPSAFEPARIVSQEVLKGSKQH